MKNKRIIYTIIVLIAIIISVIAIIQYNNITKEERINRMVFYTELRSLWKYAKNNYTPEIEYYGRINNNSCSSDIDWSIDSMINPIDNYYIKFDEDGNIIKLIVYNEDYIYVNEGKIITIEDLYDRKKPDLIKNNESNKYLLDSISCE